MAATGIRAARIRRRRAVLIAALAVGTALLLALTLEVAPGVNAATRARWGIRNLLAGPPRVGVQVGHLDSAEQPDELASLRWNTGGHADGLDEVEVNLAVARALAAALEAEGVRVDLLPARIPPNYRADAFISVHADSSPDPDRRGYKSAHFEPARNDREAELKSLIDSAYFAASGLPDDDHNTTGNMFHYYAFNHRRFRHSVARSTPAVLVEIGYLSHPDDRAFLIRPERPAAALAEGMLAYLVLRGRLPGP